MARKEKGLVSRIVSFSVSWIIGILISILISIRNFFGKGGGGEIKGVVWVDLQVYLQSNL